MTTSDWSQENAEFLFVSLKLAHDANGSFAHAALATTRRITATFIWSHNKYTHQILGLLADHNRNSTCILKSVLVLTHFHIEKVHFVQHFIDDHAYKGNWSLCISHIQQRSLTSNYYHHAWSNMMGNEHHCTIYTQIGKCRCLQHSHCMPHMSCNDILYIRFPGKNYNLQGSWDRKGPHWSTDSI